MRKRSWKELMPEYWKKILKSFEFINNFKLENNIIEYFGDIDYEGINIYEQLKSKYSQYNIKAYKTGYQKY